MGTIIILILVVLLLGSGGGYFGYSRYRARSSAGILGVVLIVAVSVWFIGGTPLTFG